MIEEEDLKLIISLRAKIFGDGAYGNNLKRNINIST